MPIKPIYNPFSGDLELQYQQNTVELAQKIQEEFDCTPETVVGDLVVPSQVLTETVEPIQTNYYTDVVFGVVTEKITPTRVKVLVSGKLSGAMYQLSGLVFGKALYVSSLGKLTTTPPTTGHLQTLGIALKSDVVFLLPSITKIIRA